MCFAKRWKLDRGFIHSPVSTEFLDFHSNARESSTRHFSMHDGGRNRDMHMGLVRRASVVHKSGHIMVM